MATKHTSFIPMSPDELPQQQINEVVDLPPRPDGLDVSIEALNSMGKDYPKGSPRKLSSICSVEWAWSPVHSRIDNYYLNTRKKHFILYDNWLNDGVSPWGWNWTVLAWAPKIEADEHAVAAHMLSDLWKYIAENDYVDHYHWINDSGCLSVEETQALARKVW